jgi:hypothetical protein
MNDDRLILVHLSDIHFKHQISGTVYDLDDDLRNEIDLDAGTMVQRLGHVDGILISGDIAFSGGSSDYEKALDWLGKLCDIFRCPHENVWTVPGNHDIDRPVIEKSRTLQMYHDILRSQKPTDLNGEIVKLCFEDEEAKLALYRPLEQYNEFATKFNCDIDAKRPSWEHNLPLNDGSSLRLLGLNSVLASDQSDDTGQHKLVVGAHQYKLARKPGVEYLTLCHHPPRLLVDGDAIESLFDARSRVQLFGHRHHQKVIQIGRNVRITAGAVHPDRKEPAWQPRYNYLAMSVDAGNENRQLSLVVFSRVWDDMEKRFVGETGGDGKDFRSFSLPLDRWAPSNSSRQTEDDSAGNQEQDDAQAEDGQTKKAQREEGQIVDPARKLAYRFLSLPYVLRIEVAQRLDLLQDEDKGVKDAALFRRFFRRAKEGDILGKLWDEVEARHTDGRRSENPFARE